MQDLAEEFKNPDSFMSSLIDPSPGGSWLSSIKPKRTESVLTIDDSPERIPLRDSITDEAKPEDTITSGQPILNIKCGARALGCLRDASAVLMRGS